jgi:hypothetical protein
VEAGVEVAALQQGVVLVHAVRQRQQHAVLGISLQNKIGSLVQQFQNLVQETKYLDFSGDSLQLAGLETHALCDFQRRLPVLHDGQRVEGDVLAAVHKVHLHARLVILQR